MKYCSKCGSELQDEALMCPRCGAEQRTIQKPQQSAETLLTVAIAFMIISCVVTALGSIIFFLDPSTILIGVIMLLPLAWSIPMTNHVRRCKDGGVSIGVGFKICTLLFVNTISGILLLCHRD